MSDENSLRFRIDPGSRTPKPICFGSSHTILSFDVEEHFRIEAASNLSIPIRMKAYYESRLEPSVDWLLEQLDRCDAKATFFVVGQIAESQPQLVRRIAENGHEVASHSWDHRRIHHHTPGSFKEDLRLSRDAIEQATGEPVFGFRGPTFSIVKQNAWAIDVLAEEGFSYDSSIFPVYHDRYGVPQAPRAPFRVRGIESEILEFPIATLRLWGCNLPAGGGGYFRLFPLFFMRWALRQIRSSFNPSVATLYFHPWEFDPTQERLPLSRLNAFRTYVGSKSSRPRLERLLSGRKFDRAIDVATRLKDGWQNLPVFSLSGQSLIQETFDHQPSPSAAPVAGRFSRRERSGIPTAPNGELL